MPTASKKPAPPAAPPATITEDVPSMMTVRTYSAKKCVEGVASLERARDKAFIIQSKLVRHLRTLESDPMPLLMAAGVAKGTVSNALTGAVVIEALLDPNLIEESVFDRFTFAKILSISRVMSGASELKLHPDQIAQLIKDYPQHTGKRKPADFLDFQDQLESIFQTGLTLEQVAERERQAAEQAAHLLAQQRQATADAAAGQGNPPDNQDNQDNQDDQDGDDDASDQTAADAGDDDASDQTAPDAGEDDAEDLGDEAALENLDGEGTIPDNVVDFTPPTIQPEEPAITPLPVSSLIASLNNLEQFTSLLSPEDLTVFFTHLQSFAARTAEKLDSLEVAA